MLNAAVSAARYGEKVSLISELGNDEVGDLITGFLNDNGISTAMIHHYKGNTSLALAFLDSSGDAHYQFYHHAPAQPPEITIPGFSPGDVLLFGSFYSINPRNHRNISRLAVAAKESGAWIYYDPNFRKPHLAHLDRSLPYIRQNIAIADIVRGSDEDFNLIAGINTQSGAYEFVKRNGGNNLIFSMNRAGVDLFTSKSTKHFEAPQVEVVSTIGAGDSFNAGFVTALHGCKKNELSETFWDQAIGRAVIFASEVCCSRDNFISQPGVDTVNHD